MVLSASEADATDFIARRRVDRARVVLRAPEETSAGRDLAELIGPALSVHRASGACVQSGVTPRETGRRTLGVGYALDAHAAGGVAVERREAAVSIGDARRGSGIGRRRNGIEAKLVFARGDRDDEGGDGDAVSDVHGGDSRIAWASARAKPCGYAPR